MKGDFTRLTLAGRKRFHKVLMQQGRVQLDQDWNEQMEILARRWELQTRDMIGNSGVPAENPGLGVSYDAPTQRLLLSPGRLYIDGLLCEAFADDGAPLSLTSQPFLKSTAGPLWQPPVDTDRTDLIYVKAWERHISAVEDESLLEPALGGADTTTRTQVVWQVLPFAAPVDATADSEIPGWAELTAAPTGTLSARTQGPTAEGAGYLPDGGGYRGLENRLYRVEVHTGGDLSQATFKWSRDNGSVAARVEEIHGALVTVASLGRDQFTGLAPGQWVEVIDDEHEFAEGKGLLAQIISVREADRILELSAEASAYGGTNARVRRWDMVTAGAGGAVAMTGDWQELELGLQVKFWPGTYRTGDYWTCAARAATATIAPVGTEAAGEAPHGLAYRYYKLALARWTWLTGNQPSDPPVLTCQMEDLRYHFPALATPPKKEILQSTVFVAPGDDFAVRLQQAINTLPDGGAITLAAGYFQLEQPLVIENRRRIAIRGVAGATRLLYEASNNTLPALAITNCAEVALEGVSLYGRNARVLVKAASTNGLRLADCRLTSFSPEGIGLFATTDLTGLTLENTTVIAAVGVAAQLSLSQAAFRNSTLRCLRTGITARAIKGLTLADSTVAHATAAMLDIASLTVPNLNAAETALLPTLSSTGMPAGIITSEASDWSLTGSRIAAGLALFATKLTNLDMRDCAVTALRGLVTLESTRCTVINCQFTTHAGTALAAFGKASEWVLEGNKLAGYTVAVRFGAVDREAVWLNAVPTYFNQNAGAWVLPADNLFTGLQYSSIPALTESAWLADALLAIADYISYFVQTGGRTGNLNTVRIRNNVLSNLVITDDCFIDKLQVTGNQFTTVTTFNVKMRSTADETVRQVAIAQNLFETMGLPISADIPGVVIDRNRIRLTNRSADWRDAQLAGDVLLKSTNPEARAIGAALKTGGQTLCDVLRSKADQLDQGANLGDLKADFTAAAAAYLQTSIGKRLAELFAQEYQTAPSASRTLLVWGDFMAASSPRPAIRCGRSFPTVTDNEVTGDLTAAGSILLDATYGPDGLRAISGATIRGNRLSGPMNGNGIVALAPLGRAVIEQNRITNMGGIILGDCSDGVVCANQVILASSTGINWGAKKAALRIEAPTGKVQIAGNELMSQGFSALYLGDAGPVSVVVTGNTLEGYRQTAPHLVELTGAAATVVLAQNHFTWSSTGADSAVSLTAKRAAITGNVWMEDNEALALSLTAPTYTLVGNVSTKELLPEGETPQQTTQHNAQSPDAYPNDPKVAITSPWLGDVITSAVTIQGTAHDRNAGSDELGVDVCTIYRIGTDGSQVPLGNATFTGDPLGAFTFNWNPAADNTPYGPYSLSAYAHSTVRDVTQASPRISVSVQPEFPGDPEVAITSPVSGTFDPGTISIRGTARDRNATGGTAGIESVSLYLDGDESSGQFLGTAQLQTDGSWTYNWNTGDKVGVHTVTAVARSRRAARKKTSAALQVTLNTPYPNDPLVAISTPGYNNMTFTGPLTVIGTAYDRNSATQPGVTVKILVRTGASQTPVEMGTATFSSNNNWSFELDTTDMAGTCTIIAAAHSNVQNVTHTAERTVVIDYPDDPQIGVTSTFGSGGGFGGDPSGVLSLKSGNTSLASGSTGGTYAYFQGWAYDRNAVTGHGIQEIRVYEDVNGSEVLRGTASIGLTSPVDAHWGHRYANCGWQFSYAIDTGDTTYIVAPTYSVTLIFEAVSAVSGETVRTTGYWTNSGEMSV